MKPGRGATGLASVDCNEYNVVDRLCPIDDQHNVSNRGV